MKLLLLCVALSALCATSFAHKVHNDHQNIYKAKSDNELTKLLSDQKAAQGKCRWVCDADVQVPEGKNVTRYPDGSWSYELQVNDNEMLHIAYNFTGDFLAIFNAKLNLTWITDGIFIGIFNMTSNALFLIDTTKHVASIFTGVINFSLQTPGQFITMFGGLFDIAVKKSFDLVGNVAFNVNAFLKALQKQTLETFFRGHLGIFNLFKINFGIYMNGSIEFNGLNTFLQPIVGAGKFGVDIFKFFTGSIHFGTKLSLKMVGSVFMTLGEISLNIDTAIRQSLGSIINLGHNTLQNFWNFGTSIFNIFTSKVNITGGGNLVISTSKTKDNAWIVNYGNETGNYSINYNSSTNMVGFYNERLRVSLVLNGNTGTFILFNLTTGIGMIVNHNGTAYVLTEHQDEIIDAFSGNLPLAERFAIIARILQENENFNVDSEKAFNFKGFFEAFLKSESVSEYFEGKGDLEDIVINNFGELFLLARAKGGSELFAKFGISIIFNAVFDFNVIGDNFASLFNILYVEKAGKFTAKLMLKVYDTVRKNISAGSRGFSNFIFGGIVKACMSGGFSIGKFVLQFGNGC